MESSLRRGGFYLGAAFLLFLVGVGFGRKYWEGSVLEEATFAAHALHQEFKQWQRGVEPRHFETHLPMRQEKGLLFHNEKKAFFGLTLYSSYERPVVELVDMEGKRLHQWDLRPLEKSLRSQGALRSMIVRDARLGEEGELTCLLVNPGMTPWGGGVVKVDRHGHLLWKNFDQQVHHSLDVAPSGTLYTLGHRWDRQLPRYAKRVEKAKAPLFLHDDFVVMGRDGQTQQSLSLMEMLESFSPKEPWLSSLQMGWVKGKQKGWGDPLHANSVLYITAEMAEGIPQLEEGMVLLFLREPGLMMALAPEPWRVVWLQGGPWVGAHSPVVTKKGHIALFDNLSAFPHSRLVHFDLQRAKEVGSWRGEPSHPLTSFAMGRVQPLPNGNLFVTESYGGRLLEVTADGERVWEWSDPRRLTLQGQERIWSLGFGYRLPEEKAEFLEKDIKG